MEKDNEKLEKQIIECKQEILELFKKRDLAPADVLAALATMLIEISQIMGMKRELFLLIIDKSWEVIKEENEKNQSK